MYKFLSCIFVFVLLQTILFAQPAFKQEVNHEISVSLDESQKFLDGHIITTYINNSPDTIEFLYYHLWPNAYKDANTKFAQQQLQLQNSSFEYASEEYRGYIDCDSCFVGGKAVAFKTVNPEIEDIVILPLPESLLPGSSVVIEMDFNVKIPIVTSRLGWKGNDFCITQWYPKPAVYDSYGWHPMSYLDMGEFYSEFGKFEVSINLPDNYIVAATGNLISKKELTRLEDYAELCSTVENKNQIRPYGDSTKRKTVRYVCNNIHDFAWFASPDFVVERESCFIESADKYVTCWAFFNKNHANLWSDATEYIAKTINMMSENVGEYPYQNCSAVDAPIGAGGGMEYPTITVVSAENKSSLERVIAHEVIHNWFYGMIASNERNNSWIDEGFTSFYESKYYDTYFPEQGLMEELIGEKVNIHKLNEVSGRYTREFAWAYLMSENIVQPASLNSEEMSVLNYFILSYYKPVAVLYTLQEYLGEEDFRKMMKAFFDEYQYKHVYPENIKSSFSENSSKSVDWFFDDFIESNKVPDYKICGIRKDSVIIKNNGECLSPLFLSIGDSSIIIDGFEGKKKIFIGAESNLVIDSEFKTLDLKRRNNYFRKGFLRSRRPVRISLYNFMDNPMYTQIPIAPIVTYNSTDGWSPGFVFYSSPLPKKTFEYQIMPLWGTKTNTLTGFANFSMFLHPKNSSVREIETFVSGRRFSLDEDEQFYRLSSGLNIRFNTDPLKTIQSELQIRNITASDYYFDSLNNFQNIKYIYVDHKPLNYWSASIDLKRGDGFVKLAAEYNKFFNYNERIGLDIRVFAGTFLYSSDVYYGNYNFRLSGNLGSQDYLYDNLYVGRNEDIRTNTKNIWAHQFVKNEGGFTLYTPYGQTDNWLMALNLNTGTPLGIVDVYANLAVCPGGSDPKANVFYEVGIKLKIFKDFLCIYFPITGTQRVWETSNNIYTDNYLQKIRFTLSLDKINLLNYRSKSYLLF